MLEYLISAIIGAIIFMLIYYFSTKKNSTLCALIVALPIMGMYGLFNICKNNSDINRYLMKVVVFYSLYILLFYGVFIIYQKTKNIKLAVVLSLILWLILVFINAKKK